jgi:hypothetical protein
MASYHTNPQGQVFWDSHSVLTWSLLFYTRLYSQFGPQKLSNICFCNQDDNFYLIKIAISARIVGIEFDYIHSRLFNLHIPNDPRHITFFT